MTGPTNGDIQDLVDALKLHLAWATVEANWKGSGKNGPRVAFSGSKGGEGKTTTMLPSLVHFAKLAGAAQSPATKDEIRAAVERLAAEFPKPTIIDS